MEVIGKRGEKGKGEKGENREEAERRWQVGGCTVVSNGGEREEEDGAWEFFGR